MASQIDNRAPPGSLFKQPRNPRGRPPKRITAERREPSEREHLAAIRECRCVSCGIDPAGEAAHLRLTHYPKAMAGMARKPEARWTTPLCRDCHSKQHAVGELNFWHELAINPHRLAETLWRLSPEQEAMRAAASVAAVIAGANE